LDGKVKIAYNACYKTKKNNFKGEIKVGQPDTRPQSGKEPVNVVVDALRHGFSMDLPKLLDTLYGDANVQHVLFMNSYHAYDKGYYSELNRGEILKSLAENAVSNMFLELPKDRQNMVDEFQKAAKCGAPNLDYKKFALDFREGNIVSSKMDKDDWGLTGSYKEVEVDGQKQQVFTGETLDFIRGHVEPLLEQTARFGIKAYMTDDMAGSDEYWEYQSAYESGDKEAYMKAGREYILARYFDKPLASFIKNSAGDERSFITSGAAHGSRLNDFEEYLEGNADEHKRVIKIDVAPNYRAYEQYGRGIMNDMRKFVPEFGEDPPDLVYLIDEKMCLTTEKTPKYVLEALKNKGVEFKSIEQLYSQNTTVEQLLMAQGAETKENNDLMLKAAV